MLTAPKGDPQASSELAGGADTGDSVMGTPQGKELLGESCHVLQVQRSLMWLKR